MQISLSRLSQDTSMCGHYRGAYLQKTVDFLVVKQHVGQQEIRVPLGEKRSLVAGRGRQQLLALGLM